jgi:hypothetical protein
MKIKKELERRDEGKEQKSTKKIKRDKGSEGREKEELGAVWKLIDF